jgi:hypothetical protein
MLYPLSYGRYVLPLLATPSLFPKARPLRPILNDTETMVGAEGFEPPTLCSQSRCATRLRHAPTDVGRPDQPPRSGTGMLGGARGSVKRAGDRRRA